MGNFFFPSVYCMSLRRTRSQKLHSTKGSDDVSFFLPLWKNLLTSFHWCAFVQKTEQADTACSFDSWILYYHSREWNILHANTTVISPCTKTQPVTPSHWSPETLCVANYRWIHVARCYLWPLFSPHSGPSSLLNWSCLPQWQNLIFKHLWTSLLKHKGNWKYHKTKQLHLNSAKSLQLSYGQC